MDHVVRKLDQGGALFVDPFCYFCSMFAFVMLSDSAVWKSGTNINKIIEITQIMLEAIEEWAKERCFLISPGKTQLVLD